MERRALGKGISALIPDVGPDQKEAVVYVRLEQVKPNPFQPREDFDQQGLEELTQSIKEKGMIQPILVRRQGDAYELIAGERRLRAALALGLESIPALVKDVTDQDSLELALIENIQREDLNPIEEARAYQYLISKYNLTHERVGAVLGKARVTVTNALSVLRLPQEIQEDIRRNRLSSGHGKALLEIDDVNHQRRLAHETISRGLSVRELENLVKVQRPTQPNKKMKTVHQDPLVAALEEELQHFLATKVRVSDTGKRGHVVIDYYSREDLERIVNKIKGR